MGNETTTYTLDRSTSSRRGLAAPLVQVLVASQGSTATAYLYGVARIGEDDGVWQYHLTDHLGSVRTLAGADGSVGATRAYRPYGTPLHTAGGAASRYGFTGEQTDATGLVYLRARMYAPSLEVFLSRDPWGGDSNRPMSFNGFNYADANPSNLTDPTGLSPQVICEEICSRWVDAAICKCYCDWWSDQNHYDLTYWLVNEMNTNANSQVVAEIQSFIISAELPPPPEFAEGGAAYRTSLYARAFMKWSLLVADKKQWDFKHAIWRKLELEEGRRSIWLQTRDWRGKPDGTAGDWFEYSVPGNIHYAYVGRAAGLGVLDLHVGASYAEVTDPSHNDVADLCLPTDKLPCFYFNPEWKETLFDDPPDYYAVELGSKLFDLFGYHVPLEGFKVVLGVYQSLLDHEAPPLNAGSYTNWAWPFSLGYFDGGQ